VSMEAGPVSEPASPEARPHDPFAGRKTAYFYRGQRYEG
jgi:hypothetical protein